VAEDDDTFVLCIKRADLHLDFPQDVITAMTLRCMERQEWLNRRARETLNEKQEKINEDEHKMKLKV